MSKNKMIAIIVVVIMAISFGTIYLVRTNKNSDSSQVTEVQSTVVEATNVIKGDIGKVRDFTGTTKDMTGTVVLNVVEEDLNIFENGQSYDVEVQFKNEEKLGKAVVTSISTTKDITTNLYSVTLNVTVQDGIVSPGSFVRIHVPYNNKVGTIVIGKNSIIKDKDKGYVYIIKDDVATRVEVTTGIENDYEIEVLTGITEGDVIITKGKEFVKDGEKVYVVGGTKDENN